jgi:di-heme oxidoreductase (putative peroxidase)
MFRGRASLVAALSVLLAAVAAAAGADRVPWPRGEPPTPAALDEQVNEAVELFERERADELLEAREKGEESEHIFVLQESIDSGAYDLERLFAFGDSAFEHQFREEDGFGDGPRSNMRRVHDGGSGGLDTFSCAGCHSVGGFNGAGAGTSTTFYFGDGERVSSAVLRNPPAVLGLGFVQALAAEMSSELRRRRDEAIASAHAGAPVTVPLTAKGVSFGSITAHPDGTVDYDALEGVDDDLTVKPFGWKGHTSRLRRFAERAARIHFGIQSHVLALEHQEDPEPGLYGWGKNWWDPDGDGRARELEEGTLTAFGVYMAMLEVPVIIPPNDPGLRDRWARGSALFDELGCSDCHHRSLALASPLWRETPDTTSGEGVEIHLVRDGDRPRADITHVMLFSDLKRHDMGDELADDYVDPDGVGRSIFLTRPLWGLAESPPYLHDGRAPTIADAILAHGGEAALQRTAFVALPPERRADLVVFLSSLTREPKLRVER